jgi:hypothetical protein
MPRSRMHTSDIAIRLIFIWICGVLTGLGVGWLIWGIQ